MVTVSCDKYNLDRLPDLVVINTNVIPAQVKKGNTVTVSCEVKNRGDATADFSVLQWEALHFILSADTKWDPGDTALDKANIDDLGAGESQIVSGVSLAIPAGITAANYYILFYIDFDNEIKELREDNNISSFLIQVIN
jgi:subtilase family serine protease